MQHCLLTGVKVKDLSWSRRPIPRHEPGRSVPVTSTVTASTTKGSRALKGSNLWRLAAYTASDPQGTNKAGPNYYNILTPEQASQSLSQGGQLVFENVQTPPFDVDKLGCGNQAYLCYELSKNPSANPRSYKFSDASGSDKSVSCKVQECIEGGQ